MKKKTLQIDPTKLGQLPGGPVERGKALAKALETEKPKTPKRQQTKTGKDKTKGKATADTKAKREVKALQIIPIEKQSAYEKRFYMRNFHEKEEATNVRHASSHTIASASEQSLAFMRDAHSKDPKRTHFRTSHLIAGITSFGPSYGDAIRNGMKKLAKDGIVKIHIIEGKSRAKYEFELIKFEAEPEPPKAA